MSKVVEEYMILSEDNLLFKVSVCLNFTKKMRIPFLNLLSGNFVVFLLPKFRKEKLFWFPR